MTGAWDRDFLVESAHHQPGRKFALRATTSISRELPERRYGRTPEPVEQFRILAVSIFLDDRFVVERVATQYGWRLCFSRSPKDAFRLASESDFDLILCGRNQPGYPWREVMDCLAESSPRSCIVLISPTKDDYLWGDALTQLAPHPTGKVGVRSTKSINSKLPGERDG
jgi:hypothetical protein